MITARRVIALVVAAITACTVNIAAPPDSNPDLSGRIAAVSISNGITSFAVVVDSQSTGAPLPGAPPVHAIVSVASGATIVIVDASGRRRAGSLDDIKNDQRARVWVGDVVQQSNPPRYSGVHLELQSDR
jgi:hypothetical protein